VSGGTFDLDANNGRTFTTISLTGGTLANGTFATSEDNYTNLQTGTVSGKLTGAKQLIKNSAGTLTLSGLANDYSGTTVVQSGTLAITTAGALTGTSSLLVTGGTLDLGGTSVNKFISSLTNGGVITNGTFLRTSITGWTLNDGTLAANLTTSGAGAINLTKSGSGTVVLSGSTDYVGTTTISGGTLQVGNGGASGRLGSGNVLNNGTLAFSRSDDFTLANSISGIGSLLKQGANSLTLSANNGYTGATTVSSGTLVVQSGGSIGSSLLTTVGTGAHLKVNGTAGAVSVAGTLSGSGTVGAMTLSSGGTLAVGNSPGLLRAASATWNPGATFQFEISNANGTAGSDWDLFSVNGNLNMTTIAASSQMNLSLLSLSLANYDSNTNYSWVFAKAASLTGTESWASGLDVTDRFAINSSGFNGGVLPDKGFKVMTGTEGGLATLSVVAVPEPSTHSLLLIGGGLTAVLFRRRIGKRT
jgi:autotransporter-associated beta strand protein